MLYASGEERNRAASPTAATKICTRQPTNIPRAETVPARRPWPMLRPITYNMSGPGAMFSKNAAAKNAPRALKSGINPPQLPATLIGFILLKTPQATFLKMVPWLLLIATLLFAFSGKISGWFRTHIARVQHHALLGAAAVQLMIAIYIGFFGAGAGILMLAMFALLGIENIHTMNGLKSYLASVCNGVAIVTFIVAKAIFWPQAILM